IIERHTFARVISKELEGEYLTADAAPLSPVAAALAPAAVAGRREQQIKRAATIAAVLVLAAVVGVFLYLKRAHIAQAPVTRAKSTLVRLTNNNAIDAGPAWSPDG